MNLCSNRTEAVVPEEVCHLSNSKITFFGRLNVKDNIVQDKILVNVSDPVKFQSVFNSSADMYALVHCTLDSSPDDCNKCLEAAIKDVTNGCNYLHYELNASNQANESSVSANNQGKRGGGGSKIWMIVFLTVAGVVLVSVLQLLATILYCKEMRKGRDHNNDQLHINGNPEDTDFQNQYFEGFNELKAHESHIDLATIHSATDNLSDSNLLGQGGFGPVYKGVLSDGKEVAVKRLSSFSEQGTREFANEVLLILKLQHKNLVRLLGFCVDNLEKLLVYEFMPNSSLDVVLFDTDKRAQLDWSRRINIINGIARGILYLHEDSRLRIIHRDLKASNVLLDFDMNPKISDFGMARIFAGAESEANTAMIVGTYGYMAPEYAMEGLYSIKSDVFSFGAWHLWNEGKGKALELMDPLLSDGSADEFLRLIHIGLLCVQEDAYDRPTMSSVVVMLKGKTVTLSQPQQPAFSLGRFAEFRQTLNKSGSVNDKINYTTNSTFENNLNLLLESLPSNTSASGGFFSTSIGNGSDQVYGQALCRASVSELLFRFGEVEVNKKETIYGLVQCTRDISRSECRNCLDSAFGDLDGCCGFRTGGSVLSRNCNMRFQMYKFYNASSSPLIYPKSTDEENRQQSMLQQLASPRGIIITQDGELATSQEFPFLDLPTIRAATDDFSDSNRLGQGGFGTVYKGVLPDGREVAVKRLSRKSWQGLDELKNEVILIAGLQHRNLVRLLGCGIEGEEKLLIYEFMPNKSLDFFIFDSEKRLQLDWKTYYDIIGGIARGLLYLHEDSRLKIIHRDLKPSNVLLDQDMVAKISDFGMARIFDQDQNSANTKKVVGTYGYMAPEYAMEGLFSVKSDVFSFGVLVLEILSGKKNSGFYLTEHAQTLLAYAWRLWKEGKELELIDPGLLESCSRPEIRRCIHIGLLCVQEDPEDRPTMSDVVVVLGSETISLAEPKKPAFSVGRAIPVDQSSTPDPSINQMTISNVSAR
ncbi:hypothetical protein COLO4_31717 [Corchorus olitorius]|uniref:non-specific serine/threonine protein kinase n=1 Tax=Corchorus olitorius TaxID=93759 RepID=A0A1R3H3I6_9ROSI|nr:hypothetical protein COLO4_31717 [Corchorus olitorius]